MCKLFYALLFLFEYKEECGNVATKIKIIFNFHLLLIKTENLQIKSVTHSREN